MTSLNPELIVKVLREAMDRIEGDWVLVGVLSSSRRGYPTEARSISISSGSRTRRDAASVECIRNTVARIDDEFAATKDPTRRARLGAIRAAFE